MILRAADYRRMAWKNGGGETAEIAVFPPGAEMEAFGWRLSMATVAVDGPFSVFPEIDRTLTVISGAGIALTMDALPPVPLTVASAPFSFAADRAVSARLLGGEIHDLNVMTRRDLFRHRVERVDAGRVVIPAGAQAAALFAIAPLRVGIGGQDHVLAAFDTLLIVARDVQTLDIAADRNGPGALLIVIEQK